MPALYEQYGGFTLGIVFAHEFGHAVQTRAGVEGDTIMTELQADCFAGAWTADVADGNSHFFELQLDDLDKAIAGFLELRDGTGTDAADPAAHGTGFDRIGAFTEGFEDGLERCGDYPDLYDAGELVIVEVPFTDVEDFERGGNLPLDEIVGLAVDDLQQFWGVVFGELGQEWDPVDLVSPIDPDTDEITCGEDTYSGDVLVNASFYCVPSDTIYLDAANLVPALYEIGDYAVATELARQFAYAAQVRLGNLDNNLATNLQADCYAGVYAYSGFSINRGEEQLLQLSPGDLDEAVIAFLLTSDSSADVDEDGNVSVGTAFTALRRLPHRVPRGHQRLRRPRRGAARSAPGPARVEHELRHPGADRDHHQPEHEELERAAAVAGVVGLLAGVGPRDHLRRRQLGHRGRRGDGGPVLAAAEPAAPASSSAATSSAARHRLHRRERVRRRGWAEAVAAASASIVRTSSRSQTHLPPSLRSRPSDTPGRARSVNATTR